MGGLNSANEQLKSLQCTSNVDFLGVFFIEKSLLKHIS